MGGNMVENLQKRGYELIVMDLNTEAVAKCLARGKAREAASARELAEASDIVMLCLTKSDVVEKIVYAEDGMTLDQLMAFTVTLDYNQRFEDVESFEHAF